LCFTLHYLSFDMQYVYVSRYLKFDPFFKNSNSNFEESSLGILGEF